MANELLGIGAVQRGDEPMVRPTGLALIWPQWMVNAATGERKVLDGPADGWVTKDEYRALKADQAPADADDRPALFAEAKALGLKVFGGIKTEDLRAKIAEAKA